MNSDDLLAVYDWVADAPDATISLRRFVLDLAVRGKLVEKNPNDEPVAELLKRLALEKSRLRKSGNFREPRNAREINRHELPFDPPEHWGWARLIDFAKTSYGFAFKSSQFNSEKRGMPLIRIRDISNADTQAYFDGDYDSAHIVQAGDYLVGMDGDFNLRRWRGKDGLLNQRVMRINGWLCQVNPEFVEIPLQMVLKYLHGGTSLTTVKHLSAKQVNGIEIPLPPLPEQHRIVTKVDELMSLCDQLEANRNARESTRNRLTKASYARLSVTDASDETFRSHARFVLNALPAFSARPDQIEQLRQTILNLAVRGKLVEQDLADEPVSELLEQIGVERNRDPNTNERKSCPPKAEAVNGNLFNLPTGWKWVSLASISDVTMGQSPPGDTYNKSGEGTPLINGPVEFTPGPFGRTVVNQFTTAPRKYCEEGDLLICVRGSTTGRTNVAAFRACIGRGVAAIRSSFDDQFIRLFLWNARNDIISMGRGMAFPSISKKQLETLPIPLPPLAEQHRIVIKVDKLMTLCDGLEAGLSTVNANRSHLLDSVLREALQKSNLNQVLDPFWQPEPRQ